MATKVGPRILVLEEKYGARYLDVSTDEKLHRAALAVVAERLREGWIVAPEEPTVDRCLLAMTEAEVAALRLISVRQATRREIERQKAMLQRYRKNLAAFREAERAVLDQDGRAALAVMRHRADYEYEGFSLENLELP